MHVQTSNIAMPCFKKLVQSLLQCVLQTNMKSKLFCRPNNSAQEGPVSQIKFQPMLNYNCYD